MRAREAATADWQAPAQAASGSEAACATEGEGGASSKGGAEDEGDAAAEGAAGDAGPVEPVDNVSAEAADPCCPPTTLRQARADALATMAETFLKTGSAPLSGGERQQTVIHVDAASLIGRVPGRCELEDGPALAVETVRRLSCDASRVTVLSGDSTRVMLDKDRTGASTTDPAGSCSRHPIRAPSGRGLEGS